MRAYGSSRERLKMWPRMISVTCSSGACTCVVPAGTAHSPGVARSSKKLRRSLTPSPVFAEIMKPGRSKACIACSRARLVSSSCAVRPHAVDLVQHERRLRPRAAGLLLLVELARQPAEEPPHRPVQRPVAGGGVDHHQRQLGAAHGVHIARCSVATVGPSAPGASTNSTCVR